MFTLAAGDLCHGTDALLELRLSPGAPYGSREILGG